MCFAVCFFFLLLFLSLSVLINIISFYHFHYFFLLHILRTLPCKICTISNYEHTLKNILTKPKTQQPHVHHVIRTNIKSRTLTDSYNFTFVYGACHFVFCSSHFDQLENAKRASKRYNRRLALKRWMRDKLVAFTFGINNMNNSGQSVLMLFCLSFLFYFSHCCFVGNLRVKLVWNICIAFCVWTHYNSMDNDPIEGNSWIYMCVYLASVLCTYAFIRLEIHRAKTQSFVTAATALLLKLWGSFSLSFSHLLFLLRLPLLHTAVAILRRFSILSLFFRFISAIISILHSVPVSYNMRVDILLTLCKGKQQQGKTDMDFFLLNKTQKRNTHVYRIGLEIGHIVLNSSSNEPKKNIQEKKESTRNIYYRSFALYTHTHWIFG